LKGKGKGWKSLQQQERKKKHGKNCKIITVLGPKDKNIGQSVLIYLF